MVLQRGWLHPVYPSQRQESNRSQWLLSWAAEWRLVLWWLGSSWAERGVKGKKPPRKQATHAGGTEKVVKYEHKFKLSSGQDHQEIQKERAIQSMTSVLNFVTLCKLSVQMELLRNYIYTTAAVTLQILISHLARDICVWYTHSVLKC